MQCLLLELGEKYAWRLQAWAVFSNHFHFVAIKETEPESLKTLISELHTRSAIHLNRLDGAGGRRVWFQYWDKHLTFQRSCLARLNYVHQNAVRHKVAVRAVDYPWCSAAWFERTAPASFVRTVSSFKIDLLKVPDDF